MLKRISKFLILVMMLAIMLTAVACNTTPDTPADDNGGGEGNTNTPPDENEGGNDGGGENEGDGGNTDAGSDIDWDNTGLEGLALIYNSVARFQVVYTSESGAKALELANELVAKLRGFGVDIADPVADTDLDKVSEYEIIIGLGARGRGDDCNVSYRAIGDSGYAIKTLGTKVVIAAGNENLLDSCYSNYVKNQMKITNKTKKLTELAVPADYTAAENTDYLIDSIKVGGVDLSEYTLIVDTSLAEGYTTESIVAFPELLFKNSGYWLEVGNASDMDSYEHRFIIRCNGIMSEKYADEGFAAYVDDNGDFIIECSYANKFDTAFFNFVSEKIYKLKGSISFTKNSPYTETVSVVYYSEFGATGKGEIDDWQALYDTHVFANQCGQTVMGDFEATYRVGPTLPDTIPVKTNVNWNGCTFIIDDTSSAAYKTRQSSLFAMERDYPIVELTEEQVDEIAGTDAKINFGDTSVPWLVGYIEAPSLVMFTNAHHKDFIRHGANESSGESRKDVFIMYPDGTIDPETEVCFEFDDFTLVQIHRIDDTPVTIENGTFINICCRAVVETDFQVKYHAYRRGIMFYRSNVTMQNVTHRMQDEPDLDFTKDAKYGGCNESYPYYAFIYTERTYNLLIQDCSITGHTTYYEDKPATESTGWVKPDPVAAGSYDMVVERSINVTFNRVTQYVEGNTGIGDNRYWGIMSSNWTKDMTFKDCSINRFDAHRSFWGAKLINTEIGHTINLVGGGELYMENVTKVAGAQFIQTRGDYGGTFRGNIYLKDCTLMGIQTYRSNIGQSYSEANRYVNGTVINIGYNNENKGGYWNWDFGFPSYMPTTVTIDNFKSECTGITYVFPGLVDEVFELDKHPLHITEEIIFKNMTPYPICNNSNLKHMNNIKVTRQ